MRRYFRRYWARYVLGVLALLMADVMQLVLPQILKSLVNIVEAPAARQVFLWPDVRDLILLAVGIMICRFGWRIYVQGNSRIIENQIRSALFDHCLRLSANFYNRSKIGDLMAHGTNDVLAVRQAMGQGVVMLADSLFMIVSTVIIMVRTISPSLTAWALWPLPVMAVVVVISGRIIHARFLRVQDAFSALTDGAQENLAGIRVVKAFVRERTEIERFEALNQAYVDRNMHMVRAWGLFDPLVDTIAALSFLIAMSYGGILVIEGHISLGAYVAFTSYLALLTWPMQALGYLINMVQRGSASLDRLERLFAETPEIQEAAGAKQLERVRGEIEFRHLTFRYHSEGPDVLQDINFRLRPGETLGIIGRTGAGKSTLINLLLRVYEPPAGTVLLDGQDVREVAFSSLREHVAVVPQDSFLFSETIAENIAFGMPRMDREAVEYAAGLAQVRENIMDFPLGFDTMVGERGVMLSGGQKQRVALARALARDPRIVVLDDALSAVDTRTEDAILHGLRTVRQNRTAIIIAHRISSLKDADLILVLEHGRVAERGRHEELLARQGLYWGLYQKQLLEEKIAGVGEGASA